jgi:hypothetical protein
LKVFSEASCTIDKSITSTKDPKNQGNRRDVKRIVIKWWIEESKVRPNMKDIVYCLVATKTWEKHAIHFLQESQVICFCATKVLFVCLFLNIH